MIVKGKVNAIRCLSCGEIVQSRSVHDFQRCPCGKVFVDGGLEYQRVGGESLDLIEILVPQARSKEVFENGGGI